jgi:dCMP deaminase
MNKWDIRFVRIAKEVAEWSKDPSTQVGSIAVKNRKIIATGYNGFPKGVKDAPRDLYDREMKLKLTVHAEKNMIYNAVEHGVKLEGSTVYIWGLPTCEECWKGLVQVGVSRVVMPDIEFNGGKWKEGCKFAKKYMEDVGIEVKEYLMDWPGLNYEPNYTGSGEWRNK